jgi:hypothetical protein
MDRMLQIAVFRCGACFSLPSPSCGAAAGGKLKHAPPEHSCLALILLLAVAGIAAPQADADRQLEAAVHREMVMGDLTAAIGMYREIVAQAGTPRPVAARALLHLGQCQEKLGQRREAHATYVRVVRDFAPESAIAAEAKAKLSGWTDAPPGPRNLRFEQGRVDDVPPGWFVPAVEKTTGILAQLRHKGCRGTTGCAVVIAPATAPDAVGNLMQSFSAAAYRGKTVRLRAWVRVEAGTPGDRAQMWLKVDRPNGRTGFYDDMDDRPVRDAEWTNCEIVAEVDRDAQFLDFGVRSIGRGRVWVDEVSFEIVPEEQVTAVRNAIGRLYPRADTTLSGFRFSGPQAVATVRTVTQRGEFFLVETARDTWGRTEDGWKVAEHVPLTATYEGLAPDPDAVRAVADDVRRLALPASGLQPLRATAACMLVHRPDLPEGSGETVLAAAGLAGFRLELAKVPADTALGRWLGEPHLFGGQPGTLAKTCDTLVFMEAGK